MKSFSQYNQDPDFIFANIDDYYYNNNYKL